jgi:hypothetical protein
MLERLVQNTRKGRRDMRNSAYAPRFPSQCREPFRMHDGVFVGREQGSVVSTIVDLMSECEEMWYCGAFPLGYPRLSPMRSPSELLSSLGLFHASLIYNPEMLTKLVLQFVPRFYTQPTLRDQPYELLSGSMHVHRSSIHTSRSAPPSCTFCLGLSFLFPAIAGLVTFISMVSSSS